MARRGPVWRGGSCGMVGPGMVWLGMARRGLARKSSLSGLGQVGLGTARPRQGAEADSAGHGRDRLAQPGDAMALAEMARCGGGVLVGRKSRSRQGWLGRVGLCKVRGLGATATSHGRARKSGQGLATVWLGLSSVWPGWARRGPAARQGGAGARSSSGDSSRRTAERPQRHGQEIEAGPWQGGARRIQGAVAWLPSGSAGLGMVGLGMASMAKGLARNRGAAWRR